MANNTDYDQTSCLTRAYTIWFGLSVQIVRVNTVFYISFKGLDAFARISTILQGGGGGGGWGGVKGGGGCSFCDFCFLFCS